VALAMEMAKEPTLLLLDEPTNHLDIESIIWLEEFLAKSSVAILMVTHDRVFLQRVVNRVLDLDKRNPKGLLDIPGDYENYVRRKSEVIAAQASRQTRLENKLRREVEWLRQGAKARTTKQQARIQAAGELSTEVAALQEKNNFRSARIEFAATDRKPKRLIEAIGVSKGFGSNTLFSNYLGLFLKGLFYYC
jgi:ATP-binding cassette subfamily F protein uup